MKKIFAMWRKLPPEMRMMLAMAGLASPAGLIYAIKRFLFPGWSWLMVILVVAGVIAVISLLGFIISRVFGLGRKKRSKKMAADLAGEADSGRVSVDVRAAIKANNDKFFDAIRDMRKNLGISVYDLPWYILIGDSGCGKTRLVNEGGLTFSTGKPEGYQLGTLNYNWWFSEDAIFVDMAGRLCNPQEDADRREWEAFLGNIAKGRRGFPINGVLACVSAEHLLQDSAEKIEQDANTALERLRDLQGKLGVTFATYLVVTKCDKILGFMQLFDRAERDITIKNQIFGWSRPGDFNELYDPEKFGEECDRVYERLNELRLRRLNDEVDETDLGLAYSFPEEFRELRAPLQTYVRTLFPMIKSPRAIKNLIFRGVYFTSATQEGALILKHLAERLGEDAASQFAPLDVYPNKRPYFIKDLLFRKVFPEHGLVFRNEQQAIRNRKLGKLLRVGTVALTVLLFGTVGLSTWKFGQVIGKPRDDATKTKPKDDYTTQDALQRAGELQVDVNDLQANLGWARVLSLGWGARQPITDINTIRAALFEKTLLQQAWGDISQALCSTTLEDPRAGSEAQRTAQMYLDALEEYVAWFCCADRPHPAPHMTFKSFEKLCAVVQDKDSPVMVHREAFFSQAASYFNVIREREEWRNPAQLMSAGAVDPQETIRKALVVAYGYLDGYATLDENHPDPLIREWMRIRVQCASIETSYGQLLDAAGEDPQTLDELQEFKEQFVASYQTFAAAVDGLAWQGESTGIRTVIKPLRAAILAQRDLWIDYEEKLNKAYARCSPPPAPAVSEMIAGLGAGSDESGLSGLDRVLWTSLRDNHLTDQDYSAENFEYFEEIVQEVDEQYAHIITLQTGEGAKSDELVVGEAVVTVAGVLKQVHDKLRDAQLDPSGEAGPPSEWTEKLEAYFEEPEEPELAFDLGTLPVIWRPDELDELYSAHLDLISRGEARRLLRTIYQAAGEYGDWGLAQLTPDWSGKVPSVYNIPIPRSPGEDEDRKVGRAKSPKKEDSKKRPRKRKRSGRGRRRSEESRRPTTPSPGVVKEGDRLIPACATRGFLVERAEECADLLYYLREFDPSWYYSSDEDEKPLNELCVDRLTAAGEAYMAAYVRAWSRAYEAKRLAELERLLNKADDWQSLAKLMKSRSAGRGAGRDEVADELSRALAEILEAVPFWGWSYDEDEASWYSESDSDDGYWLEVVSWMQGAIEEHWPQDLGRFAVDARLPADELEGGAAADAPWEALTAEFLRRWKALSRGIGANAVLPRKFEHEPRKRDRGTVSWGAIERLRDEARIDDERLTAQLVTFEKQAQELLSAELTSILCGIQSRFFQRENPYDGWPYLNESGEGLKALQTVDFGAFKRFLVEIERAWKYFEPLEEALPREDELALRRAGFYRGSREWLAFLRLKDELSPDPLQVAIEGGDPVTRPHGKEVPQDTAQHRYAAVALDLGLCFEREGMPGHDCDRPLRIATLLEEKILSREAIWRWTGRTDNKELSLSLVDGLPAEGSMTQHYPNVRRVLGESSPLALCAYLHRHGVRHEGKWITSHKFDLAAELRQQGKGDLAGGLGVDDSIIGEKFIFKLERLLPDPIAKLGEAVPPEKPDRDW